MRGKNTKRPSTRPIAVRNRSARTAAAHPLAFRRTVSDGKSAFRSKVAAKKISVTLI